MQATDDPFGERGLGEAFDRFGDGHLRMPRRIGGHGDQKRALVFRPAPALAAVTLLSLFGTPPKYASSICTKPLN
jgi:hypothetical protein